MTAAVLVIGVTVAGASVLALAQPRLDGPTFHHGPFEVSFTDGTGAPIGEPYFDTAGAMPRMAPRTALVRIENNGNEGAAWRLAATALHASGSRSLDEVLEVTVRHHESDAVIYRGRLSQLAVESPAVLAPGESAAYVVAVTWPDTPADDNPYQGARLSFALQITATQA